MLHSWLFSLVRSEDVTFLKLFFVGFHLPQSVHKCNTIRKNIGCFACFENVSEVFVQFVKVLSDVLVLRFLRDVHEQI